MNDETRYVRMTLRLPQQLHAHLADSAASKSQSVNTEIVVRLAESFGSSLLDSLVPSAINEQSRAVETMSEMLGQINTDISNHGSEIKGNLYPHTGSEITGTIYEGIIKMLLESQRATDKRLKLLYEAVLEQNETSIAGRSKRRRADRLPRNKF